MKPLLLTCALLCTGALWGQLALTFSALDANFTKPRELLCRGDGSPYLYVLGKDGPLHRYNTDNGQSELLIDLGADLEVQGEAGLLGAAFHPNSDSSYLYLLYTVPGRGNHLSTTLHLSRFAVNADGTIDDSARRVLLSIDKPTHNKNGGGLAFGPDGYLYIGVGDGGGNFDPYENGQNPLSLLGKILRIDVDRRGVNGKEYAIPTTNPFVGVEDTLDEIWSLGLRNPFRLTFDERSGDLWISDKANSFWQEINFQPAGSRGGQNYGWNCREGFEESYPSSKRFCGDKSRVYDAPRIVYGKTGNDDLIGGSVTGGKVYYGPEAELHGRYVFGDFYGQRLFVCMPGREGQDSIHVIRDTPVDNLASLGTGSDGSLYAVDYSGTIYLVTVDRTSATRQQPVAQLSVYPNPTSGSFTAQWSEAVTTRLSARLTTSGGRLAAEWSDLTTDATGQLPLQVAGLPPGLYFLTLSDGRKVAAGRLALQ